MQDMTVDILSEMVNTVNEIEMPLQRLSDLAEECDTPENVTAWRPSGSPQTDLASHDLKVRYPGILFILSNEQVC